MDLSRWSGRAYTDPPAWVAFKIALGGKRWRCEYCRLNFSSFRDRKEAFTFSRWKKFVPATGKSSEPQVETLHAGYEAGSREKI
jgi:hypothetical protein